MRFPTLSAQTYYTFKFHCSELIQAIEKDHKGIRRKAVEATKGDGPFPQSARRKKPATSDNIFEEMQDMVDKGNSDESPRRRSKYGSALILDHSRNYFTSTRTKTRKTYNKDTMRLTENDFDF